MAKHITIRIVVLIALLLLAIPVGLATLDPNRRCGTGDGFVVIFYMLIFYACWCIFMLIEAFRLHKKQNIRCRNFNIIAGLTLPALLLLSYILTS